jgi:hypothetical protein
MEMGRASRNLAEGVATFAIGLVLRLFTGDVETPIITLSKVGVVLMVIGGALVLTGLFQAVRGSGGA